ncbi:MAG: putative RNase H-like nuclease (RuvC/YqgF family) [Candidatus Nanohaloarchaea archaeon]|jgi:predicted RNase H-like nuclease (RuvC/YqgF family)
MNKEPLIVGIDPGNTSAVAALNLDGELEFLISRKEFSHDRIIREIVESGYPIIIATDRAEIPSTVDKIASSVGARKFTPENNLSRQRKDRLGKGDNSHEKDAYASALHAYKRLSKQIRKINNRSDRTGGEKLEIAKEHLGIK